MAWAVVGGEVDKTSVSLRVFGDDLEPDQISLLMGCQPTQSCRKGDTCGHGKFQRIEKTGKWLLHADEAKAATLDAQINSLLDRLTGDLTAWRELNSHYRVDLFCGLFLENLNRGTTLTGQTLQRMAERGIPLGLDIYGLHCLASEPGVTGNRDQS